MEASCKLLEENIFGTEPFHASQFLAYEHGRDSEYIYFYAVFYRIKYITDSNKFTAKTRSEHFKFLVRTQPFIN